MKKGLRFLSLVAIAMIVALVYGFDTSSKATAGPANGATMKPIQVSYLNLAIDPVQPGGLTPTQIAALQGAGYIHMFLSKDLPIDDLESLGSAGPYRRSGILQAGTEFYWNPNDPDGIDDSYCCLCANRYTYWRAWVRAGY